MGIAELGEVGCALVRVQDGVAEGGVAPMHRGVAVVVVHVDGRAVEARVVVVQVAEEHRERLEGQVHPLVVLVEVDAVATEVYRLRLRLVLAHDVGHAHEGSAVEVGIGHAVLDERHQVREGGKVGRGQRPAGDVDGRLAAETLRHGTRRVRTRAAREVPDAVPHTLLGQRTLRQHEPIEVDGAHVGDARPSLKEAQRNRLAGQRLAKDRHLPDLEGGTYCRGFRRLVSRLPRVFPTPTAGQGQGGCQDQGNAKGQDQRRGQGREGAGAPRPASYHPTFLSPANTCW